MEKNAEYRLVFSTMSSLEEAQRIARILVEECLVACVNILPAVHSIYSWQGVVQQELEVMMLLKSSATKLQALEQRLLELHSYEVPEFVVVGIDQMSDSYRLWMNSVLSPS